MKHFKIVKQETVAWKDGGQAKLTDVVCSQQASAKFRSRVNSGTTFEDMAKRKTVQDAMIILQGDDVDHIDFKYAKTGNPRRVFIRLTTVY